MSSCIFYIRRIGGYITSFLSDFHPEIQFVEATDAGTHITALDTSKFQVKY